MGGGTVEDWWRVLGLPRAGRGAFGLPARLPEGLISRMDAGYFHALRYSRREQEGA